MRSEQDNKIDFIVVCINDYADKHHIHYVDSFNYLSQYGALDFIEKYYDVEHTLPFQDVLEDMSAICRQHGGTLA